jgi:hypothetical protein
MPNGFTTGCKSAIADASGKDLEEVDGVWNVAKGWVLAEGEAEAGPNVPGVTAPITVSNSDAGDGRCL